MDPERLQKIIARSGLCSRREAEQLIRQGKVSVNGSGANIGDKAYGQSDHILVNGKILAKENSSIVILLNKPIGYISTCQDTHGRRTLISLIPRKYRKGIHPVGRLDMNSRGAILLTNCGELTLKLTHPRYLHHKTYHVLVQGNPSQEKITSWRNGVKLDGIKTKKAKVYILENRNMKTLLKITLTEGRNRQIRRICNILGHPVLDLQRTAIGNLDLKDLPEGKYRILKYEEWKNFL